MKFNILRKACAMPKKYRSTMLFALVLPCLVIIAWSQGKVTTEEEKALAFFVANWKILAEVIAIVGAGVGLYYRMENRIAHFDDSFTTFKKDASEHWLSQERAMNQIKQDFEDHKEAETPHGICAAHKQALTDVNVSLNQLHEDVLGLRGDITSYQETMLLVASGLAAPKKKES